MINIKFHSKSYLSMEFKIISFNGIQNHIFQFHSKSYQSMKFWYTKIHKTALYMAVEKEKIEMLKLLLTSDKLDINILNIFHYFLWNSKSYHSITFKILSFNRIQNLIIQ